MSSYYEPDSMHDLVLHSEKLYADQQFCYSWHEDDFISATYAEFISDVRRSADWFIDHGYKDRHIMLFGHNSYEWLVCYVAITAYVGVCICAGKDWKQYDLARGIEAAMPDAIITDAILQMYTAPFAATIDVFGFNEVFTVGGDLVQNNPRFDALARKKADNAVVVFTTGTTSFPKAAQLTLANMFANGQSLYSRTQLSNDDVLYMFLPMYHIYSQVCVSIAAFLVGAKLYMAHDLDNLQQELQLCRPTMIAGVPLFFERVLSAIADADMRKIKKVIKVLNFLHISSSIRRRIFHEIHGAFGGQLKVFTSGGALLNFETKKLLRDVGFMFIEGYGMSEASGVVSAEIPGRIVPGSVGKILENVKLKINNPDNDGYGEIMVYGRSVMAGYLKKGAVDTSCFDKDGYFKTSDEGFIDSQNNIFLRGRIGRSLVLSSGENISIDEMMTLIKSVVQVDKIYVSQNEGYLEASIFSHQTEATIKTALDGMNKTLPKYKQIHKWMIIDEYAVSGMK